MTPETDKAREQADFQLKAREAQERERGKVLVMCDACPARVYDTLPRLRSEGWQISREWAFCPSHQGE